MSDTLELQTVTGKLFDLSWSPQVDEITIRLSEKFVFYKECSQVVGEERTVDVDAEGVWEAQLLETDNMREDAHYIFNVAGRIYKKKVPINPQGWEFQELPNI
jgi:hypothetical protein